MDKRIKEANVAYDEKYLLDLFRANHLTVEQIHYGGWSNGQLAGELDFFQDIVVFRKNSCTFVSCKQK